MTDVKSESGRLPEFHLHTVVKAQGVFCVQGHCCGRRILGLRGPIHARGLIRVVEIVLKIASWHLKIAKFSRLQAQLTGAYKNVIQGFVTIP